MQHKLASTYDKRSKLVKMKSKLILESAMLPLSGQKNSGQDIFITVYSLYNTST